MAKWSQSAAYRTSAFLIRRKKLALAERLSPSVDESALDSLCSSSSVEAAADRIEGARIALVGPALQGSTEKHIEDCDIVARIGFTGIDSIPANTGHRCDISIYARHHARRLADAVGSGKAPKVEDVLLRSNVASDDVGTVSRAYRTHILDRGYLKAEIHCSPNILPQFAAWLLAQHPSELHVTHADLFLTKYYPLEYAVNKPVIRDSNLYRHHNSSKWDSFSKHNPFTHLLFYKWLARRDNVSFSTDLEGIVGLSAKEYGAQLLATY